MKFMLDIDKQVHGKIKMLAVLSNKSMNDIIVSAVTDYMQKDKPAEKVSGCRTTKGITT